MGVVYIFDFSFVLFLQEGRIIDFIDFIMALIGIDPTMIVINSLTEGSTKVEAVISTENYNEVKSTSQKI